MRVRVEESWCVPSPGAKAGVDAQLGHAGCLLFAFHAPCPSAACTVTQDTDPEDCTAGLASG